MFIYEVPEHKRETHHYGKAQNQPHYGKTKVCFPGWRFVGPAHRPENVDIEMAPKREADIDIRGIMPNVDEREVHDSRDGEEKRTSVCGDVL